MNRILFVLVSVMFALPAFAAGKFDCENGISKLQSNAVLFGSVDRAAAQARFGSSRIVKTGKIFNAYKVQSCLNRTDEVQAVSVHFKVKAKNQVTGVTQVYACLAKQKRERAESGRWASWAQVQTSCRKAQDQKSGDSTLGAPYASVQHAPYYDSHDDVYDPYYYDRSPSFDVTDRAAPYLDPSTGGSRGDGSGGSYGGNGGGPYYDGGSGGAYDEWH